jgi:hypothetical protein
VNSKGENSSDFCLDFVPEFGLWFMLSLPMVCFFGSRNVSMYSSWLQLSSQCLLLRLSNQQPCSMVKSTRAGSFSLREKLPGSLSTCPIEKVLFCAEKRELESPSLILYKGFGDYSMNKTRGRRKMFITRANAASRLNRCSAPSQLLLKALLWAEITL